MTEIETTEEAPEVAESTGPRFALIFELETIAAGAREAEFSVLQSVLHDKNKEFNEIDFSRFCIAARPEHYLDALLPNINGAKLSAARIAEDVNSGVALHLTSSELEVTPGFEKIVTAAQSRDMILAAITGLPENVYAPLIERLGLEGDALRVVAFPEVDRQFPRADAFLKVAKELDLPPRQCTVLVTSASSGKSALTAGMRCVAIPDRFTAYQDFGGAAMVVDSLAQLDIDEALASIPS